jgi:hypothetical protein
MIEIASRAGSTAASLSSSSSRLVVCSCSSMAE